MKYPQPHKTLIAFLALPIFTSLASAASIMFDFGPTTVSGGSLTNSPYHSLGGSSADNTWNQVQLADINSGLTLSNGAAAAGVTLNLGVSSGTTIGLSTQPVNSSALGSVTNFSGGIYASPSAGRDAIFASSTTVRYVGLQIGGLASGTYDIFIASRNTNTAAAHSQFGFVGKSTTEGDFDVTGYLSGLSLIPQTPVDGDIPGNGAQASWQENVNYTRFSINLAEGEFLTIAANGGNGITGAGGPEARGFLNAVQIMQVPEPSSALILASALAFGLARRRRA